MVHLETLRKQRHEIEHSEQLSRERAFMEKRQIKTTPRQVIEKYKKIVWVCSYQVLTMGG